MIGLHKIKQNNKKSGFVMTSHNKPVSTIIEKANRTSCHRKNFIYANNRQKFAILRAWRKAQNLLSEP